MLENTEVGTAVKDAAGNPIVFRISDKDLVSIFFLIKIIWLRTMIINAYYPKIKQYKIILYYL